VPADAKWNVVCYDVRDAKRLRRVAKHLEGRGERMQSSVFRFWLGPAQLQKLRWELTEMLDVEDDVLFIPLCSRCVAGLEVTHAASKRPDWPESPISHKIV
jgi:CRISPR-associated protein Cas2